MADRTLGPGAKGDPEKPGVKHYEVEDEPTADAPTADAKGELDASADGEVAPEDDPDDTADEPYDDEDF